MQIGDVKKMKKIKRENFVRTNDSILLSLLYSLAITIVMCLVFCVFTYPNINETPDDQFMMLLVSRIHTDSDGLMIFQNIVYNKILLLLYNSFSGINWYFGLQLAFMFLAIAELSYVIFRKSNNISGILLNCAIIPTICYYFINHVQFTRTGAIVSIAGILLAFYTIECKLFLEKVICIIVSIITVLFGSWVRFESTGMVALVISAIGIVKVLEILKDKAKNNKIKLKQIGAYVLVFTMVFALPISFEFVNNKFYHSDEFEEYSKFNSMRSDLYDKLFPEYNENVELYEELGISAEDLKAYKTYIIDLDVLNNESFEKLLNGNIYKNTVLDMLYYCKLLILNNCIKSIYFYIFVVFALLAIFSNKKRLPYIIIQVLLQFTIICAEFFYLYYNWRVYERVISGVYFAGIISMFFSIDYNNLFDNSLIISKKYLNNILCVCLSLITLSMCGFVAVNLYHYQKVEYPKITQLEKDSKHFYDEIAKDKDTLYIYDVYHLRYPIQKAYGVYDQPKIGSINNALPCGDWYLNWPTTFKIYSKYGVSNVFKDCVNNEKIYFVPNSDSLIESYIKENYNSNAHFELVKTIGEQNIYKVVA